MLPQLSTILAIAVLIAGAVAICAMMALFGTSDSARANRYAIIHKASGWLFSGLYIVVFIPMVWKVSNFWQEEPSRVTVHVTLSVAALFLLLLKLSIPRFFPAMKQHLFLVGTSLYLATFCLVAVSGGYYLIWHQAGVPYVSHAEYSMKVLDIRLGQQLLVAKCSNCHTLKEALKPRTSNEWEKITNRMVQLAAPRITPDEAAQILNYLVTKYPLKPAAPAPGVDLVAKYCKACHTREEIYGKFRFHREWLTIVQRMSAEHPKRVPKDRVAEIVDYIVEQQELQLER